MAKKRLFFGFSTANGRFSEKLSDVELIKQDLINHLMTRKGARVMRPDFGSIIHDKIGEPFTSSLKEDIVTDVTRIVNSDSRLILNEISASSSDYGITVGITITYTQYNTSESFTLNFDTRNASSSDTE